MHDEAWHCDTDHNLHCKHLGTKTSTLASMQNEERGQRSDVTCREVTGSCGGEHLSDTVIIMSS